MTDEETINRVSELTRKEDALTECVKLMTWFCSRVDKGEVRSKKTYAKFKALLFKIDEDFETPGRCPKCDEIVGDVQEHYGNRFSDLGDDGYNCNDFPKVDGEPAIHACLNRDCDQWVDFSCCNPKPNYAIDCPRRKVK